MTRNLMTAVGIVVVAALMVVGGEAAAQGLPKDWQLWYQTPASPSMERINEFHILLNWIITAITLFVLVLMVIIAFKFNEKANPKPSKTTHNTALEVLWTAIPVVILVIIAVPSLKLVYFIDKHENPEMTLKITGHQWYWSYIYPDHEEIEFDSIMLEDDELKPGQPRLLAVDNPVVLPVGTNIQLLHTAADVIHNWAVPAFGLKTDTVPGRTNETWVRIDREGDYYGQCSEICGTRHGFMPIHIVAVSKEAFAAWTKAAQDDIEKSYEVLAEFRAQEKAETVKVADAASGAKR